MLSSELVLPQMALEFEGERSLENHADVGSIDALLRALHIAARSPPARHRGEKPTREWKAAAILGSFADYAIGN